MTWRGRWVSLLLLIALLGVAGCQSAYYSALEQVGIHRREVLVDRVEEGRNAQQAAEEQFSSALEQFRAVVRVPESELSRTYDRLNGEYEDSEAAAERVRGRIDAIEHVAEALGYRLVAAKDS